VGDPFSLDFSSHEPALFNQEFPAAKPKKWHTPPQRVLCRETSRPADSFPTYWQHEFLAALRQPSARPSSSEVSQVMIEVAALSM
jgi:hypothetical protein